MTRPRLTYANVMSTIGVFLLLGGATAFAAVQLGKNSVGSKQLKKNAVTTAKIKKNAVTKAKIKAGAVDGSKVADGSLTGADIDIASTPFTRIVAKLRGSSTVAVTNTAQLYPLDSPTYTQAAGESVQYFGAVDVTFAPSCTPPRTAGAYVTVDSEEPLSPLNKDLAAGGATSDASGGAASTRVELGTLSSESEGKILPGAAKTHTLALAVYGNCGGGSGINATAAAVDVIGAK